MIDVADMSKAPKKFKAAYERFVSRHPPLVGRLGTFSYRECGGKSEVRMVRDDGIIYWLTVITDDGHFTTNVYNKNGEPAPAEPFLPGNPADKRDKRISL